MPKTSYSIIWCPLESINNGWQAPR